MRLSVRYHDGCWFTKFTYSDDHAFVLLLLCKFYGTVKPVIHWCPLKVLDRKIHLRLSHLFNCFVADLEWRGHSISLFFFCRQSNFILQEGYV